MSTKIYNAYKLNIESNPSYGSVCQVMDKLKEVAHNTAEKQFVEQMMRTVIFNFDIKNIIGIEKLDDIIKGAEDGIDETKNSKERFFWRSKAKVLESVKNVEKLTDISLFHLIEMVGSSWEMQESENFPMTASMCVYPHEDDVLVMLFGNHNVTSALAGTDYLIDYHYQNQTDKPDDVSDEEWDKREQDWDETIGPDYIPNRHGMKIDLVNIDQIREGLLFHREESIFNIEGLELPSIKSRISHVAEYMDCPIKKTDAMGYSEFIKLYNEWKDSLHLENKLSEITMNDFKI